MKRIIAFLGIAIGVVGCQSPSPAFDPFTGYGANRVPPPATGSIGQQGGYYQPPTFPNATPPAAVNPGASSGAANGNGLLPVPTLGTPPPSIPQSSNFNGTQWSRGTVANRGDAVRQPTITTQPRRASPQNRDLRQAENLVWTSPVGAANNSIGRTAATAPVVNPLEPNSPGTTYAPPTQAYGSGTRTPAPRTFTPPPVSTTLPPPQTPRYLPAPVRPSIVRPMATQSTYVVPGAAVTDCCTPLNDVVIEPRAMNSYPYYPGRGVVYTEPVHSSGVTHTARGWQPRNQ